MPASRLSSSGYTTVRMEDMMKYDMMANMNNNQTSLCQGIRYTENVRDYIWGKPIMRMMLELQCTAVAIIVATQVWMLAYYDSKIFERLVSDEISLPLLYLAAIIFGTLTFVRPSYWRIVMALTLYCLVVYFAMMVTNLAMQILITPGLAEVLQGSPENIRVWIPWAIGFALHLQMIITSVVIVAISLRDMYKFSPVVWTKTPQGFVKHNIIVGPITTLNNNNLPSGQPSDVIVHYV